MTVQWSVRNIWHDFVLLLISLSQANLHRKKKLVFHMEAYSLSRVSANGVWNHSEKEIGKKIPATDRDQKHS